MAAPASSLPAAMASFSVVAKGLAAGILGGFVVPLLVPSLRNILGLVAARAIPRPWTLLTAAFVQDNIVSALAYAVGVLFLTRIVEPIYGPRELLKYLLAVIAVSSFCTVAVVTVVYYATLSAEKSSPEADHAGDALFRPMAGFEAGLAALLVAVKQLIPDNEVALLGGALKFRAKHLPGLYVALMVAVAVLLGGGQRIIPFTLFGTYAAWFYLRFLQTRNNVRGDLSDEFRAATFFPQPLQPLIDQVAGACTRLTGLGAASGSQQQQASWNYAMGGAPLPGTDAGDAARRRERGAKALEERLGIKKAAGVVPNAPAEPAQPSGPAPAQPEQASAAQHDVEAGESVAE